MRWPCLVCYSILGISAVHAERDKPPTSLLASIPDREKIPLASDAWDNASAALQLALAKLPNGAPGRPCPRAIPYFLYIGAPGRPCPRAIPYFLYIGAPGRPCPRAIPYFLYIKKPGLCPALYKAYRCGFYRAWALASSIISSLAATATSTRRFLARPSAVELSAMGLVSPKASTVIRLAPTPFARK